jgi:putative colanic acid biosynthesis acetyltransferase WcaF
MSLLNAYEMRSMEDGPSFSLGNRLARVGWMIGWIILARWTPIPMHGWRCAVARRFGARIGRGVRLYPSVHIWWPGNLEMADYSCLGRGAKCYNQGKIVLGYRAVVSQGAHLCASSHEVDDYYNQLTLGPIRIEAYAWVAADAFVGPHVTIGEGAVLGARGVAMRSLEPWTIFTGNPAIPLRKRAFRNAPEPLPCAGQANRGASSEN